MSKPSMTSGEMGCPYCTDRQNLIEYLSLAIKHPDIAKLWSTRNNTPANEIYPQSKEKAFWICTKCFGNTAHQFEGWFQERLNVHIVTIERL